MSVDGMVAMDIDLVVTDSRDGVTPAPLNWKEQRVVALLKKVGKPLHYSQISNRCFPGVRPTKKAHRQVLNSVRKPERLGLLRRLGNGVFEA